MECQTNIIDLPIDLFPQPGRLLLVEGPACGLASTVHFSVAIFCKLFEAVAVFLTTANAGLALKDQGTQMLEALGGVGKRSAIEDPLQLLEIATEVVDLGDEGFGALRCASESFNDTVKL